MPPHRRVKYADIDAAVLAQMPITGRLNRRAQQSGEGIRVCTVCGQQLRVKADRDRPGKDHQDYRFKAIKDIAWDPSDPKAWVACEICEPCNRTYFELDTWKGAT